MGLKEMKKYKYRAEFEFDVFRFHLRLHQRNNNKRGDYSRIVEFLPHEGECDVSVTFDSTLSLDALISLAASVIDCHVIEQTLQPEELYTGDRDWERIAVPS